MTKGHGRTVISPLRSPSSRTIGLRPRVSTNTAANQMAGFVCVLVGEDGAAHITTIGVAPEHRRRGLAEQLLSHLEHSLKAKKVGAIVLEVRISNTAAQNLYRLSGFSVVQRISNYYNNGEDGFLMMKSLI